MYLKDTTWNQHGGVGATLLLNWVEERAVGADRILKERNVPFISERGHADILAQSLQEDQSAKYTTVSRMSYQPSESSASRRYPGQLGKLKTMKERAWTAESVEHLKPKRTPHPTIYKSTTAADYFDDSFSPAIDPSKLPPALLRAHEDPSRAVPPAPLTFWSHFMARGAHTTYSSTPHGAHPDSVARATVVGHTAVRELMPDDPKHLPPLAGAVQRRVATFGRHTAFSTPIAETVDSPHKE
ncbi:hypothetical protein H9P43_000859 [Blastocladiella emersonii ATCC 22665]|nr:hypothetical protein H9P43_000859 [Blastocladiella emersonii ATCC 22665]